MRRIIPLIVAIAVLTVALPSHATQNTCSARKTKCVGKLTAAALKCHEFAERHGGDPLADPAVQCLQKAHDRFDGGATPSKGMFARSSRPRTGGNASRPATLLPSPRRSTTTSTPS